MASVHSRVCRRVWKMLDRPSREGGTVQSWPRLLQTPADTPGTAILSERMLEPGCPECVREFTEPRLVTDNIASDSLWFGRFAGGAFVRAKPEGISCTRGQFSRRSRWWPRFSHAEPDALRLRRPAHKCNRVPLLGSCLLPADLTAGLTLRVAAPETPDRSARAWSDPRPGPTTAQPRSPAAASPSPGACCR